jgi:hypothetical protein
MEDVVFRASIGVKFSPEEILMIGLGRFAMARFMSPGHGSDRPEGAYRVFLDWNFLIYHGY